MSKNPTNPAKPKAKKLKFDAKTVRTLGDQELAQLDGGMPANMKCCTGLVRCCVSVEGC